MNLLIVEVRYHARYYSRCTIVVLGYIFYGRMMQKIPVNSYVEVNY